MKASLCLVIALFLILIACGASALAKYSVVSHTHDTAQSLYLKATQLIRDGDYANARIILERVLHDFPSDEMAVKADERLTEILDKAKGQARERSFASGPGLYVVWKNGQTEALPAFKMTNNNMAAESGDAEDGFVRALSEKTPYRTLVLSDVDKIVLNTPAQNLAVFRLEQIATWVPYHRATDLAPLEFAKIDDETYSLDLAQLGKLPIDMDMYNMGSGLRRGGVSAPPDLSFNSTFMSQLTGTWGKQPGPVIRIIWPFDVLSDYREYLMRTVTGGARSGIAAARAQMELHPDDLSIDLYLAEQQANSGDLAAFGVSVDGYLQKARAKNDSSHLEVAMTLGERAKAVNALREYVTQRQTLSESPELTGELTRYAESFQFHVAYYLLSLLRRQSADYDGAEKFGKVAESLVKDDCPLLWYCGLIDTAGLSQKEAQKAAKSIYKANREEIKALRKQQRK